MLFNSYIFILLFLPIAVIGWLLLNKCGKYSWANIFLVVMSLWFYGYFNPSYLWIIGGSILVNFMIAKMLNEITSRKGLKKFVLGMGIVLNAGCIFYYKYYDFFISNINVAFKQSFNLQNILLPLGISFFTFQQISYLVDSYKGETKDYNFVEYALFVSFFPQLVAGPIVLHSEIIPQFRKETNRKFCSNNLSKGLFVFAIGLFKKVLIADTFGKAVSWGFGTVVDLSSLEALIVSLSYTLQLYFDFSGYCDMAVGIGYMFNIELPQNFNSPYKAFSILEFWDRWHMSLTRFLRQYIYFPLGGSKKGKVRTYVNVMVVYLISGIWHGANWTFILWGVLHGIANCVNRILKRQWDRVSVVIKWFLTFSTVNILWIIFRADSIEQAFQFINKLCSMNDFEVRNKLMNCFVLQEIHLFERLGAIFRILPANITGFYMWGFLAVALGIVLNGKNSFEINFKPNFFYAMCTVGLLVWSIVSLSGVSEFLYFNF